MDENFNRVVGGVLARAGLLAVQPNYRFFESKETKDRYFWTTEKCAHRGGQKFVAGIYRFYATKNQFKLVRRVGFAKRYKSKEWARNAFNKKV